jgi:hypothetical protein
MNRKRKKKNGRQSSNTCDIKGCFNNAVYNYNYGTSNQRKVCSCCDKTHNPYLKGKLTTKVA